MSKAPIDTNVKVPAAVARAAAASEAAHSAAYQTQPTEPPAPPADGTITIVPPQPLQVTSLEITELPPTAPPTVTPPGNPADPNDQSWKHKFDSVNGRYTRLLDQTRQQGETITSMQDQISGLNDIIQAMTAAPTATNAAPQPRTPSITPDDVSAYGQEFIDVVQRAARDAVSGDLEGVRALAHGVEQKVTTVDRRIATETDSQKRSAMEQTLDRECPTWRDVNMQDEFKAWLLLQNPYTGDIRNNELQAAWAARKTPQVLAFFRGFLSEQAATAPLNNGTAPPAIPPTGVSLEDLAAPGRARAPAANEPPAEKPVITKQQITDFYTAVRQGKYRGRDEEKDRHEAMIIAASREGRVR